MAIQLRGSRTSRKRFTEINVTPFVDVMLVLLIVFMVTAPLMTVGVSVDLPKSEAPQVSHSQEPLTISVTKDQKIFIQETEVELDELVDKLDGITEAKRDQRLFIRGDQNLHYGLVMGVLGKITSAGYLKVALLAALPQPGGDKA